MEHPRYTLIHNENGPDLGTAGAPVLQVDGLYFKDLARTGELLPYEDWRLDPQARAEDLASRLSIEEIAGLMMYSPHQTVPAQPGPPWPGTYGGKPFAESGQDPWELSDQQLGYLSQDHIRHILAVSFASTETAARWSNNLQALAESLPWGIPVNLCSDPRHGASKAGAEYKLGGGEVSKWPEGLGIAATFDPEVCRAFGEAISQEYRALGLTTALSPQVDLATEPRWMRFEDTFGTSPAQVTELGKIYCDSLQTTQGAPGGWGRDSVCAMAKHWPGGGPCEAGRDAHYAFGKYAVYPGENLPSHMKPFLEGAFQLDGPTGKVSAVMPYYTISYGLDQKNGKNVGNSYSQYLVKDLLREKYGFDGVVCTDWGITDDPAPVMDSFGSRCFGVEDLTVAQRHLLAIENGVDQFGGNSDIRPVLEAYQLGCQKYGEQAMRQRMEESAVRLLRNIFRCGLFENPYLDPQESQAVVGREDFVRAGFEAQRKSLVLVKNQGALPLPEKKKVYIPTRHVEEKKSFFRGVEPEKTVDPLDTALVEQYFTRVETPQEADFALVVIESPLTDGGYSQKDAEAGGTGYVPITLQYRPYQADTARQPSLAGGDFRESFTDRSYRGKVGTCANEGDLDLVLNARQAMGDKPVVVCLRMHNPTVLSELEPSADAILIDFGVQQQAILDIVSGRAEPSGLLPVELPASMETVEAHCEDVPFDMEVYVDQAGHAYGYGYGMNWSGPIADGRALRYPRSK